MTTFLLTSTDDVFDGGDLPDTFVGPGGGNDALDGGGGADAFTIDANQRGTIEGGSGTDTLFAVQDQLNVNLKISGVEFLRAQTATLLASVEQLASFSTIAANAGGSTFSIGLRSVGGALDFSSRFVSSTLLTVDALAASSAVQLTGTGNADNFVGSSYNDTMNGGAGNDTLAGGSGADTLDGGAGADILKGGTGNDTYYIDSSNDVVDESDSGGGIDTVRSSNLSINLSYATKFLGSVEYAVLGGSKALNLTGNSLNNYLQGNAASNVIDGSSGADVMVGVEGNDTYYIDNLNDVVDESSSATNDTDTVRSSVLSINLSDTSHFKGAVERAILDGSSALNLTGNTLNNYLQGNTASNIIDGSSGADTMVGLAGSDTYYVDNLDDIVDESSSATADADYVRSAYVSLNLADTYRFRGDIEHAILFGYLDLNLTGNALVNYLQGNAGNNVIDGGSGADQMIGLAGNDTYIIDNTGDIVDETAASSGGQDTIVSSNHSIFLADTTKFKGDVENATLMGSANLYIQGNGLNNILRGNDGANVLIGGNGGDTYYIDKSDVVDERGGAGNDTIYSKDSIDLTDTAHFMGNFERAVLDAFPGAVTIKGNDYVLYLDGNSGDNTLSGGHTHVTMAGGAGNDTYWITNRGASVIEVDGPSGGIDTVCSTISYTLVSGIEKLILQDTALDGYGNNSDNVLQGNSSDNRLIGAGGNDTMLGLGGNDTYIIDSLLDVVDESSPGSSGVDEVRGSMSLIDLSNSAQFKGPIERAVLESTVAGKLVGNSLDNYLQGNKGADTLDGGLGADRLYGYLGKDSFVFSSSLSSTNVDVISDFAVSEDVIVLAHAVFAGLSIGALSADAFYAGTSAHDLDDRIIYNKPLGAVYFDPDGTGAASAIRFATLAGAPSISASDFLVV